MKNISLLSGLLLLSGCVERQDSTNQILLLVEEDCNDTSVLDKEFEQWNYFYHKRGLRHLFMEMPYAAAQLLNIWIKSDNDEILEHLLNDWGEYNANFNKDGVAKLFRRIKELCPETVFHGTDIEHQYDMSENRSGAKRYLRYLEEKGMKDSKEYQLTLESIEQGRQCNAHEVYRENVLVENFQREFEAVGRANILGIYGAFHVTSEDPQSFPNMTDQLLKTYGNAIQTKDILKRKIKGLEITPSKNETGQILLLGEIHADKHCLRQEFEQWYTCYRKYGFRHLFMEVGYASAQLLNLWIKSDNDEILDQIERNLEKDKVIAKGPNVFEFYRKIKRLCPETVFHGTDMEHQYETTGKQYLKYLDENGRKNSNEYKLALQVAEQRKKYEELGKRFWHKREEMIIKNFKRELDSLNGTSVIGTYASSHTADRLLKIYENRAYSKELRK